VLPSYGLPLNAIAPKNQPPLPVDAKLTFATELITFVSFAFADAIYLWLMDTAHFVFVMALLPINTGADVKILIQIKVRLRALSFNIVYRTAYIGL